jgi:tetratricopeptide (TPR) repeat protein
MAALDLLESHKYAEAVAVCVRRLAVDPNDFGAMDTMASALRALEKYEEALPLFERVGAQEKECKITPGHPGRQEDISCLNWFLGNRQKAIALMRGLVDGILDGSIQYGDLAGGMKQGLLLYYMAVTEHQPDQAACALDYMRNRINQLKRLVPGLPVDYWPVPVARYYLGELAFGELLSFARTTGFTGGDCGGARQADEPSQALCGTFSRRDEKPCPRRRRPLRCSHARVLRAGGPADRARMVSRPA